MLARVTMLFVILSLLLTINAAALYIQQLQASNDFGNDHRLHHPAVPRKLMANEKDVAGYEAKDLASSKEQNKPSSGELHKNLVEVDVIVHVAKGTRQEWIEGSDSTHEFFTMDYSHVRRRRPIHNKSSLKTIINSP